MIDMKQRECQQKKQYKQRIIGYIVGINKYLDKKYNRVSVLQVDRSQNEQKQYRVIRDLLQLDHSQFYLKLYENNNNIEYPIEPQFIITVLTQFNDIDLIKTNLPKLYPLIPTLNNHQLILLFTIIHQYQLNQLPSISSVTPQPLQGIQPLLYIFSKLYQGYQSRIIPWLYYITIYQGQIYQGQNCQGENYQGENYQGQNISYIAYAFFSMKRQINYIDYYNNQILIQRSINRIAHLTKYQKPSTQINIIIKAIQSEKTTNYAEQILIEIQNLNYTQINPSKTQSFFIYLQKHIHNKYSSTKKQLKTKQNKYKILQLSPQGDIIQKPQEQYTLPPQIKKLEHHQIPRIEKLKFLNSISKKTLQYIINLNWKKVIGFDLLLQYWSLFETFEPAFPWNLFQSKLIYFTCNQQIIQKFTDLPTDKIISVLQTMEKLKINKANLLVKLLGIIQQRLSLLKSDQLISVQKVCVTFVDQCEDFLQTVGKEMEKKKCIFEQVAKISTAKKVQSELSVDYSQDQSQD